VACGLAVRHAVAEALYPGRLGVLLANAQPFIVSVVRDHCAHWAAKLGQDTAVAEAMFGAMRGIIAWLLQGGPDHPSVPQIQTFILRGVRFHFGRAVKWPAEPVGFGRFSAAYDEPGVAEVDAADEFRALAAATLAAADRADPSGGYRRVIEMRHGLVTGRPMTFGEMGAALGVRRQAAYTRYAKALRAVRALLRGTHVPGTG
jgi:hypothetical protein